MITLINGMIFIDNVIATNPEYIGLALQDFAETLENDGKTIILKDADVFVENVGKCIYDK
jgi:hypothetical protein